MIELSLFFSDSSPPELVETVFSHPLLPTPRVAVRGRPANIRMYPYSFQWSPAVKALAFLFLKGAIGKHLSSESSRVALVGQKRSLALSLDHAISKQPTWLFDMFGQDANGNCILRKIITRRNSGLKRPEPIEIGIDIHQLSLDKIKVFITQKDISNSLSDLQTLSINLGLKESLNDSKAFAITPQTSPMIPKIEEAASTQAPSKRHIHLVMKNFLDNKKAQYPNTLYETHPLSPARFSKLLSKELFNSLRSIDIFTKQSTATAMNQLWQCSSFAKVAGKPCDLLPLSTTNLSDSLLSGESMKEDPLDQLLRQTKLKIHLPAAMVGALAIFIHMREVQGYPLDITFNFPSTGTLLKSMIENDSVDPPDICGLSIATSAVHIGQKIRGGFSPLSFTPKTSHRVISPKGKKNLKALSRGHYVFDTQPSSTTSYFFEDLEISSFINKKRIALEHMQTHEMSAALATGNDDIRAILWFPFDQINLALNNSVLVYGDADPRQWKETVLFAHETFLAKKELCIAFNVAMRRSWKMLLDRNSDVETIAQFMANDPKYMNTIYEHAGLLNGIPPTPLLPNLKLAI